MVKVCGIIFLDAWVRQRRGELDFRSIEKVL